jgi:molybdopterin/thiamine biosynthesis adenylyltransferase
MNTDRNATGRRAGKSGGGEALPARRSRTGRAGDGRERRERRPGGRRSAAPRAGRQPLLDTSLLSAGSIVIVGLGGIGSVVSFYLTMFLAALGETPVRLLLVDGDSFERRNRERMDVPEFGNKAVVWCRRLLEKFGRPGLVIRPVDAMVTRANVAEIVTERSVTLACLDNHASRKLLSDRCRRLRDVTLISGGNDGVEDGQRGTYGNVQVYCRRRGIERNPCPTRFHPEILHPTDTIPDVHCADLAATTAPQILFANLAAASAMLNAFYRLLRTDIDEPMYDEVCFDILEARAVPHWLLSQQGATASARRGFTARAGR